MAESHFPTKNYPSTSFLESAGTILFNHSTRQICLVKSHKRNVWLLPKGRRNIGETRQQSALRETSEETGLRCHLLPVNLHTRCPPAVEEPGDTPDEVRLFEGVCEPFMVTHRMLGEGDLKLIWWFIGMIDEDAPNSVGEEDLTAELFGFEEALATLTFKDDREVVRKAIEIYEQTFADLKRS